MNRVCKKANLHRNPAQIPLPLRKGTRPIYNIVIPDDFLFALFLARKNIDPESSQRIRMNSVC
jgi:hypothetical protein